MATTAEMALVSDPVPAAKKGRSRKALKQKNPIIERSQYNGCNCNSNEANILAAIVTQSHSLAIPVDDSVKENLETLTQQRSEKKTNKRGTSKAKKQTEAENSFEKELLNMQEKLQKMTLEKEQTEEMLKAKEDMLKQKEEELEARDKEQEKLQIELKKLQKMKEFKPTLVWFLNLVCINLFFVAFLVAKLTLLSFGIETQLIYIS